MILNKIMNGLIMKICRIKVDSLFQEQQSIKSGVILALFAENIFLKTKIAPETFSKYRIAPMDISVSETQFGLQVGMNSHQTLVTSIDSTVKVRSA